METSDYEKPNPGKSDHEKYVYFQPGEIVYFVTRENDQVDPKDIEILINWSQTKADKHHLKVSQRLGEELHFPATRPGLPLDKQVASSLGGHYHIPDIRQHFPFTFALADVSDTDKPDEYVDSARLSEFILELDNSDDRPQLSPGTVLDVVSPNWISSLTSEFGGGGGPGARPEPFQDKIPPSRVDYEFQLPEDIDKLCSPSKEERGKGVVVAILDTAPCLHDLAAVYEKWQKVDPKDSPPGHTGNPQPPHGLIESLLKPGGPLTIHPASYEELVRMRSVHLKDHNYNMTNHGLFIAGIIHSIAPAAEIHLYEVLNPDGVGDLKSIAWGLWKVFESFRTQPLVVNCSLVLNIPLLNHGIPDLDPRIRAKIIHESENPEDYLTAVSLGADGQAWLERQGRAIEWICDLLYAEKSRVIAAAGNDNKPSRSPQARPQARYPAAFESVLGVGGLRKRLHRNDPFNSAEYSNWSDQPKWIGITTFGGEKGASNAVLGVYLGKFPSEQDDKPGPENGCDWAWWAGTSFATPIISGVAAAVMSAHPNWTTEQAIQEIYKYNALPFPTTSGGEDVLDVTQGPRPV